MLAHPLSTLVGCQNTVVAYSPLLNDPLFQMCTRLLWVVVPESRMRKFLAKLILKLGYPPGYFTFQAFPPSGDTLDNLHQ